MLLGCIGDDFTGSSDLANTLSKEGMSVTQYSGIPSQSADPSVEVGVVALKSRSIDPGDAVQQSLDALEWLQKQGCKQYFFKYCSTFDSSKKGNIGPVVEAMAHKLGAEKVIICPAFPGTGRSVYQGHLFVNDALLNESGMENHPLTPMIDADLRRWLGYQTSLPVGHVNACDVLRGADAIKLALEREHNAGNRLIVVDALQDDDLRQIGAAADGLILVTGGSGVALGLPANFRRRSETGSNGTHWSGQSGKCVVLSGSCSSATRAQLQRHTSDNPKFEIVAEDVISGSLQPAQLCRWLMDADGIPVAYSSAEPQVVKAVQEAFGSEKAASALEAFFAETARQLVAAGVERLIVAGGETSGAVVEGLELRQLSIGPEIDPGVPALRAGPELVIALKSGNFGAPDFFGKAADILAEKT